MKTILKTGVIVILSLLSLSSSQAGIAEKISEILKSGNNMPDKLPNTAIIRLRDINSIVGFSGLKSLPANITSIEPLLPKNQSLTFNSALKESKLLNSGNADQIINAEQPLLRTIIITYDGNLEPEKFCKMLKENDSRVEIAEPYYLYKLQGLPDDPYAPAQTILTTIKADSAWGIFQGDTSVVIGISDNGIWQQHEDLINSIAPNWKDPVNGVDDDNDGYIDDYLGYNFTYLSDNVSPDNTYNSSESHGTEVAGIAGATFNNAIGITGTAGKCRIFPIKTAAFGSISISYGYQSLIYAAHRGLKVLNCSWGLYKPPSLIDQSVVDYAVANNVAIVAAGGNYDSSPTEIWYPAGYRGVLGVGEVDQYDHVTSTTAMAQQIRIMAPGKGNYSTSFNQTYPTVDSGTSFASPAAAGFVAMIRARYPQLNAMQSIEFARHCTDDISSLNPEWSSIIPGRINMLKAVQTDPMNVIAVNLVNSSFYDANGNPTQRFSIGSTVQMKLSLQNILKNITSCRFELGIGFDPTGSIELTNTEVNVQNIATGAMFDVGMFKFNILNNNTDNVFLKITVYDESNNKVDFFLVPFLPSTDVTTFTNNVISFSVSDEGLLGYGGLGNLNGKIGVGFIYKDKGNQLYQAGLMATESDSRQVNSLFGFGNQGNDFRNVKPFATPDSNIGVVNDTNIPINNEIGLKIQEEILLPPGNFSVAKINVTVTNISGNDLTDVAAGYYIDWDIGPDSDSNYVQQFSEAIPVEFTGTGATAEIASFYNPFPVFGAAALTADPTGTAQAAGLEISQTFDYQTQDWINTLNSGTTIQTNTLTDISMVVGMKFTGTLANNASKTFSVYIGGGETRAELAKNIQNFIHNLDVREPGSNNPTELLSQLRLFPQPVDDNLTVSISSGIMQSVDLQVLNLLGTSMNQNIRKQLEPGTNYFKFDTGMLPSGCYILLVKSDNGILSEPFIKH
jgi:hypothetical protein